jgi:hypothetical protein
VEVPAVHHQVVVEIATLQLQTEVAEDHSPHLVPAREAQVRLVL